MEININDLRQRERERERVGGNGGGGGVKEMRASSEAFLCFQSITAADVGYLSDMLPPKTLSFFRVDVHISPSATGRNTSAICRGRQVRPSMHVCIQSCVSVCLWQSEAYCQPSREPGRGHRPGYVTSLCQLRLWQSLSNTHITHTSPIHSRAHVPEGRTN